MIRTKSFKHIRANIIIGIMLSVMIATASAAQDEMALSRVQAVSEHLQALSESLGSTMPVYYDYMENGSLTGGKVVVDMPSVSAQMLAAPPPPYLSYTLIDNGPVDNRINLVCVGDGYTSGEIGLYWQHVNNVIDNFFQEWPLQQYASFFNVHVVEVISNESGVDEPDLSIYRDTALDMAFDCSGIPRLLCVDYTKAWTAASNAPATDLVLVLANTTRYGGAGYADLATLSGGNSGAVELALHEFGHSFADLADEYHYSDGTTYSGSEPSEVNISVYTAAQQAAGQFKWYRWLNLPEVDTFEGAYYNQYGIYRPTDNSKMKVLGVPFGPINNEQFIFSTYNEVSLIDQIIPSGSGLISGYDSFSVVCQQPMPNTLEISWQVDGVPVPGADDPNLIPADHMLPNTAQTLTVLVTDQTDLVRDEGLRQSVMTAQRSWQVWKASADFDAGGAVDIDDLTAMIAYWLSNNPGYDIAPPGGDGIVDLHDFAVMGEQWSGP